MERDRKADLEQLAVSVFRLMRIWEQETSRHIEGLPSPGRRHVVRAATLGDSGLGVCTLAERLHVSMSTASRLLEAARREGLVTDLSPHSDGRFTPVRLTRSGSGLLDLVAQADVHTLDRATRAWSDAVLAEVVETVGLLWSHLDRHRPRAPGWLPQ